MVFGTMWFFRDIIPPVSDTWLDRPLSCLCLANSTRRPCNTTFGTFSPDKYKPMEEQDVPLQVTALTSDGVLLTCGGFGNLQCLAFDREKNSWQPHSSLDRGKMWRIENWDFKLSSLRSRKCSRVKSHIRIAYNWRSCSDIQDWIK